MAKHLFCAVVFSGVLAAGGQTPSTARINRAAEPGKFDYYVLTLSWSPQYCSNHTDPEQCAGTRKYSFVMHGLWPQYERRWPENCEAPSPVPDKLVQKMLEIMPSPKLVQHEWDKHGTCSGLGQDGYFAAMRTLWDRIRIPKEYQQPLKQVTQTPARIRSRFLATNQDLTPDSFRLGCSGRFISQVQICLTKDFNTRACSSDVRDTCKAQKVIFRPVR
jgi:ribonuclease T2